MVGSVMMGCSSNSAATENSSRRRPATREQHQGAQSGGAR